MPEKDRDLYLWQTFQEFWPPWVEHVEEWKHNDTDEIRVTMKKDGYVTHGNVYIFGDHGCDQWHLEQVKHPASVTV